MQHYWGAKAILERLGYSPKSFRHFPAVQARHQIPCYKKRKAGRCCPMYYSNESMILGWEMQKAKQCYEQLQAELAMGVDRRYKCRERERQAVAA